MINLTSHLFLWNILALFQRCHLDFNSSLRMRYKEHISNHNFPYWQSQRNMDQVRRKRGTRNGLSHHIDKLFQCESATHIVCAYLKFVHYPFLACNIIIKICLLWEQCSSLTWHLYAASMSFIWPWHSKLIVCVLCSITVGDKMELFETFEKLILSSWWPCDSLKGYSLGYYYWHGNVVSQQHPQVCQWLLKIF